MATTTTLDATERTCESPFGAMPWGFNQARIAYAQLFSASKWYRIKR